MLIYSIEYLKRLQLDFEQLLTVRKVLLQNVWKIRQRG